MTGEMKAKFRLVRCPRCRLVLPELPDVPVYKCGGCGTVLQATHRKTKTRGTEFCHNETDENGKVAPDHIPVQNSCLNQATIHSKEGSSAEASTSRSSDKFEDCNIKQPGDKNYSDELPSSSEPGDKSNSDGLPSSSELSSPENGNFSPELGDRTEQDKQIGTLDQDTGEDEDEFGDCHSQWHRARSFSDDFPSSMELTCHETEDSSPEFQSCLSLDRDTHTSDYCTRMDETGHGDCKVEHATCSNFHSTVSTTEDKHEENELSPKFVAHGEEGKCIVNPSLQDFTIVECKVPESADRCRESSSFTESDCSEHEKPTTVIEAKKKVELIARL